MNELRPLSSFPSTAKLFVGLFTTLVMLMSFWGVWDATTDSELPDENGAISDLRPADEIDAIASDSETALAPIWDTNHAGEPAPLNSSRIDSMQSVADLTEGYDGVGDNEYDGAVENRLSHNIRVAQLHVSGRMILFFALGAIFLFTSVKPLIKKIAFWLFAVSVVGCGTGLVGMGHHRLFYDVLVVSDLLMLAIVCYMCATIYVDLRHSPQKEQ